MTSYVIINYRSILQSFRREVSRKPTLPYLGPQIEEIAFEFRRQTYHAKSINDYLVSMKTA